MTEQYTDPERLEIATLDQYRKSIHLGLKTHGMSKTRIYGRWRAMVRRCLCPRDARFQDYGGRGISVCVRWLQFAHFLEDMGMPPNSSLQLERKNNDGHYTPDNCKWGTHQEQARNKRNNRRITFNGSTKTLVEWAQILRLRYDTLQMRLQNGWPVERAFGMKVRHMPDLSRFRGVSRNWNKWRVDVYLNHQDHYLGVFTTEIEAAKAYNAFVIQNGHPERINAV